MYVWCGSICVTAVQLGNVETGEKSPYFLSWFYFSFQLFQSAGAGETLM